MAHGEVHEIGRPAWSEDRLLGQARNDALDGDEEQRQNEQVQQEPVQSHRGRSSHRPELGARASEQGADRGESDAGEAEDLAATKNDTQRPETEADDEHHVDQEAHQVHRIVRARRRCREPVREQETQHAAVPQGPAGDRQDATDPARAEALARPSAEARGHAKAKARAGFSTRSRVSPASSTPLARRRGSTFTSRWW